MTAKKNSPCTPNSTTQHPITLRNMIPVDTLRQQMQQKPFTTVCPKPGVYRWWFPVEVWENIKSVFAQHHIDADFPVWQQKIDGNDYVALYFGQSKKLKRRIKQHVFGPNILSTLRRSIKAILIHAPNWNATVNQILDECYWEWDYVPCPKNIERGELSQKQFAYPLNIKNNKTVPKEWIRELKKMRGWV